ADGDPGSPLICCAPADVVIASSSAVVSRRAKKTLVCLIMRSSITAVVSMRGAYRLDGRPDSCHLTTRGGGAGRLPPPRVTWQASSDPALYCYRDGRPGRTSHAKGDRRHAESKGIDRARRRGRRNGRDRGVRVAHREPHDAARRGGERSHRAATADDARAGRG